MTRGDLYVRFSKVILGAGYSPEAAQAILDRYFEEYYEDVTSFIKMLERYEGLNHGQPE